MRYKYKEFVKHPRYSRGPRDTGRNPKTDHRSGHIFINWHSPKECRIPNTAIPADLTRQTPATIPVTHYFDVKRQCCDCGRQFIFFAEEQKYWYEELAFGLDSDCIRCVFCRKQHQELKHKRKRYEELFHISNRTVDQILEMADCCMTLVEASVFHRRQIQHIKMLLKSIPTRLNKRVQVKFNELRARLLTIETQNND